MRLPCSSRAWTGSTSTSSPGWHGAKGASCPRCSDTSTANAASSRASSRRSCTPIPAQVTRARSPPPGNPCSPSTSGIAWCANTSSRATRCAARSSNCCWPPPDRRPQPPHPRVRARGNDMTAPQGRIDAIAPDTYRISIAMPEELFPGGFTFNQFLVVDEQPLLFHTGPKKLFPLVREQIEKVMPLEKLRWISFSHNEADECGSLAEFLAAAPNARPACGRVANMIATGDQVDVEALALEDGEVLVLGKHRLVWQSTPHLPHGWECGFFYDETTGTLFCGDL